MILEKRIPFRYLFSIVKYDLIILLSVGLCSHFIAVSFMDRLPVMPLAIPAFLGTSLSVLLSFKMNQSYDRWWEARKIWGAIVNDSRTLVIQLQSFLDRQSEDIIKKIAYRQIAWCYITGSRLRNLPLPEKKYLPLNAGELHQIKGYGNQSLQLIQMTAKDLQRLRSEGQFDVRAHIHLQETVNRLTDSLGGAERINRTVFPSTYRLVLHFITYLFVITLAISLREVSNLLAVPLLLLVSASFLLIEKIAYHLQDPFRNRPSDVPVTSIANNIERDIRLLLGEEITDDADRHKTYFIL